MSFFDLGHDGRYRMFHRQLLSDWIQGPLQTDHPFLHIGLNPQSVGFPGISVHRSIWFPRTSHKNGQPLQLG